MGSFNWDAFTTNFLNTVSAGMAQRSAATAEENELLQDEYKEAKVVFNNRKKLVDNGIMLAGKARGLGANDMQIKAAIASGESGLANFVKSLSKFTAAKGNVQLGTEEINTLVEGAELFEPNEVNKFLERSYGLLSDEAAVAETEDKRSTLQNIFMVDPVGSARARFDPERMSIIELARQDAYSSLAPDRASVYLTTDTALANVYDSVETFQSFMAEEAYALRQLEKQEYYQTALGEGEQEQLQQQTRARVIGKYVKLYGNDFIKDYKSSGATGNNPYVESLFTDAVVSDDQLSNNSKVLNETDISKALKDAVIADNGTLQTEVIKDGRFTIKYNVDANGNLIGDINFIKKMPNGDLFTQDISSSDPKNIEKLRKQGFVNLPTEVTRFDIESAGGEDILSGRGLEILDAKVKTTPEKTYYLVDGKAVDGVPPRPELGIGNVLRGAGMDGKSRDMILSGEMAIPKTLRPGQWDELFGDTHDPETGKRLTAPKGAVGLGSPTRKGQDQEPNFEGPLSSALPQSGITSAASEPKTSLYKDDGTIDEAIRDTLFDSSLAEGEITVEELPPADVTSGRVPEPEPAPINVVSTQEFGRQSFSVTPDGKVYINDRKTGKPKAEVTDSVIKESVLDQNKQFIRGAVTTFFNDAKEKGYTNDKARLLEAWKRFAGKNSLSSYVTKQVLKSIEEGR